MSRVGVVRCHYFRDTRLQREVAALLDRGNPVHVLCRRDRAEPLRKHRGKIGPVDNHHAERVVHGERVRRSVILYELARLRLRQPSVTLDPRP